MAKGKGTVKRAPREREEAQEQAKPTPDDVINAVKRGDYNTARQHVLDATRQGRATYLPAGARDNNTAQILIDGRPVGQASSIGHYVDQGEDVNPSMRGRRITGSGQYSGSMFGEKS